LFSSICTRKYAEQSVYEERNIEMSNVMKPLEYSASPAFGQTKHHRKSRHWVWITLGVVAPLCVLGGVLVWNFAVNPALAEEQHYIAIKNQDYAKAYTSLRSEVQARLSKQAFIQQAQQQDEALGKMTRYSEDNLPFGDPATITETVTRAHGTTYIVHLQLRQEGGTWKITSFDRI
jgi:hypothetical protein